MKNAKFSFKYLGIVTIEYSSVVMYDYPIKSNR